MGKKRSRFKPKQKSPPVESIVEITGPPTAELLDKIRYTLECELWYRNKKAIEHPGIWLRKANEVRTALDNLEELGRRAGESVGVG